MIGKLQRVPLRDVWKREAADFTVWLRDNIDVLNEATGLSLSSAEREQPAGTFSIDLVAEDGSGTPVVIENQLEKSDHDHLGKLVTYLTAMDAHTAVWIVAEPRPEHIAAIARLNQSGLGRFYMLKVEAVRINESEPAPMLTLIAQPSEEGIAVGKVQKEFAERHGLRQQFWAGLLETARKQTRLHANLTPSVSNTMYTGSGKSGIGYQYAIRQHDTAVELYIDRGAEDENLAILDELAKQRSAIEAEFGQPLDWQRVDGRRYCKIEKRLHLGGYRDEEKWSETQQAMVEAMVRLERALKSHIAQLRI